MTPERWQQVKTILDAAHGVEARDRARFLAKSYAGDEDLRGEVESFLEHEEAAVDFIETSAFEIAAGSLAADETLAGRRIGHYELVREIGRGGMGAVYRAPR